MFVALALAPAKKLSKKEFLSLSRKGQNQYLEKFPKSSHRYLIEKPGSKTPAKETAAPKPFKSDKKDELDDLEADPRQTPYHKRADSEKEEKANTLPAVIKKNEEKQQKENEDKLPALHRNQLPGKQVSVIHPHVEGMKESRAVRVAEHRQVAHEIANLNRDSAAVINPHSIKALQHIKPQHLVQASRDIDTNRKQIIDVVGERVQEHPKLFDRGLKAMDKMFQGAKKLTPKDAQAGKRVLTQIAIAALLGTSVLALTMGAAPLAVVSARMLWDVWHHSKEQKKGDDKKKKDEDDGNIYSKTKDGIQYENEKDVTPGAKDNVGKKALLGSDRLGNKIHQDQMRKQGFKWDDEKGWWQDTESDQISADDFAKAGRKKGKGTEVQPRKPKKQKHWSEEESEDAEYTTAKSKEPFVMSEDHAKTINTVIDQLSDVLKYQSSEDIQDMGKRMFSKASDESKDLYLTVYNAVAKLATGRLSGVPGVMFYGMFNVNIDALAEITERICQVTPEVEVENGQKCFHFATDRTLVTVGVRANDRDEIQFMITEAQ